MSATAKRRWQQDRVRLIPGGSTPPGLELRRAGVKVRFGQPIPTTLVCAAVRARAVPSCQAPDRAIAVGRRRARSKLYPDGRDGQHQPEIAQPDGASLAYSMARSWSLIRSSRLDSSGLPSRAISPGDIFPIIVSCLPCQCSTVSLAALTLGHALPGLVPAGAGGSCD